MAESHLCRRRGWSLLQIPDDLMPVGSAVLTATDMDPIILSVSSFENQLVEVGVGFEEVEPLVSDLHVGVTLVVVPGSVGGERQTDVGSFAQGVLGGVGATNFNVELVAAVAGGDDDGAADEGAKGFEDYLAELLQNRNVLRRNRVVDSVLVCGGRAFELGEFEMFG